MTALTVKRWGNSLALRIPAYLAEEAQITEDAVVEAEVKGGVLVLKRKVASTFSFGDYIAGLQAGEEPEPTVGWGAPVGEEFGASESQS